MHPALHSAIYFHVWQQLLHGADKVVKILQRHNVKAAAIHGNKSQNARQDALANFKNGGLRVLVATDIAARGIDVDDLSHVINFELPNIAETYVHRIGRTGRAGLSGIALSFCDVEEREFLRDINKLIVNNIPVIEDHPFPSPTRFVQVPTVQKNPMSRRPASHANFRRTRGWSQSR